MKLLRVASYKVLIGLEVHVQLATASKLFTAAPNAARHVGADPNSLVDEVVLGLPGVLPVMNKRAVEYSIMVGLALGCKIATLTKWDRKSYFYPDLPKNYQISQYDLPLCCEGFFELPAENGATTIRIRRAHLEEDAGKLLHEAPGGFSIDHSIVDLNRAGTPLLEIVTEPDFTTPEQVRFFAQELQRIVQFLGVSEGQMQSGHMRFEPNINLHITDGDGAVHRTAITEIKNLNSFSVLERATAYEIRRQLDAWAHEGILGDKCTMGWDEGKEQTFVQRKKENTDDYRYFPDPDLMPVEVDEEWLTELKAQVGEMPAARRQRYIEQFALSPADAAILTADRGLGDFFEGTLRNGAPARRTASLILSHGLRLSNERGKVLHELGLDPILFAEVALLIEQSTIAASTAAAVFDRLLETGGGSAAQVIDELGLRQVSNTDEIDAAIEAAMAANPKAVADVKAGRQAAIGSLVGAVMKGQKGLNPKLVQERLRAKLA